MKFTNIIAVLICLFTTQIAFASQNSNPNKQRVYKATELETKPQFKGGQVEIVRYLSMGLSYPEQARENAIMGTVVVEFIIDEEGKVQSPRILKGLGFGCDEEVLRTVTKMPAWQPGIYNGFMVKSKVVMPVRFELTGF